MRNSFDISRRKLSRGYRRDARMSIPDFYDDFEQLLDDLVQEADNVDSHNPHMTLGLSCTIDVFNKSVFAYLRYKDKQELFSDKIEMGRLDIADFKISRDLREYVEDRRGAVSFLFEGDDIWVLDDNKVRDAFERGFFEAWRAGTW